VLRFELREGGTAGAEAFVGVSPQGTLGLDAFDAYALAPPRADYLTLATVPAEGFEQARLSIQSVPDALGGETALGLDAGAVGGASGVRALEVVWDAAMLPNGWSGQLVDTETGQSRPLAAAGVYPFEIVARGAREDGVPTLATTRGGQARFQVVLTPGAVGVEPDTQGALALSVTPNPVSGRGAVRVSVPAAGRVRVAVYDVLGREVAVLVDGDRPAGLLDAAFETARLAPGVYVVRLETGGETVVRRITVVR
jgi:hypothetical protein